MPFTSKEVEAAAKHAENPDSAKAESLLLDDLNKVDPKERLDFLKAVSKQTIEDQKKNWSLPVLEISGMDVKQVKPSTLQQMFGPKDRSTSLVFHNPETALQNVATDAKKSTGL